MTLLNQATDTYPYSSASEFLLVHGRLPRLGDPRPPWDYAGWLLPLVQMTEMHLRGENSRWAYHLEIIETGRLPDRPIPPLAFHDEDTAPGRKAVQARLHEWARLVGWDMGGWSDFRTLLEWLCWGLGLSKESPKLHREDAAEKLYRAVNLDLLLQCPTDHFGAWISEHKGNGWNPSAFYPTPHPVVHLMTEMTFHDAVTDGRDTRTMTVCDPCVGTGRMLLHAGAYSLRLYGNDIDPVVVMATLINGALYVPWLTYPIPEAVFDGCSDATPAARSLPVGADEPGDQDGHAGPVLGAGGARELVRADPIQDTSGCPDVPGPGRPGPDGGGAAPVLTVGRRPRDGKRRVTTGQGLLMFEDD